MKKIANIKNIVDKYQYLNIITIVDEAYDKNLSIYRTCVELSNPEVENLFFQEAKRLNKLDIFEKYETVYLNLLNKIFSKFKILCFKYDEWPDKPDNSIEIFEIKSFDEFELL